MNRLLCIVVMLPLLFQACQQPDGDKPGSEYMPDMGHSIAYEANHYDYYYFNTWGSEDEYHQYAQPREPVSGTIPRGYARLQSAPTAEDKQVVLASLGGIDGSLKAPATVNGKVPYYYEDTEDERTRASVEILSNPFPITESGLKRGKELYNIFCAICHGEKGDGLGYLVAEENPNVKYPAAPANFLQDTFYNSTNGRYYHALIYGKNVMGGYADKISYEERWQVIHWIRALQAKEKKLVYSEETNTMTNPTLDIPANTWIAMKGSLPAAKEEAHGEGDHSEGSHDEHGHDDHGGDHGHDGHDSHSGEHHGGGNH